MLGRPLKSITLTTNMRKQLESMVRSRTLPQGLARRAKIVLMAADGKSNTDIEPPWGCGASASWNKALWGSMTNCGRAHRALLTMSKSLNPFAKP